MRARVRAVRLRNSLMESKPSLGRNTIANRIGGRNRTAWSMIAKAIASSRPTPQSASMETAANSNVPMDMGRPGTVLLKNVIDIVMTIIAGRLTCKSVASTTNQPTTPRSPACSERN